MSTLCPPYKGAKLSDISQKFGNIQSFDGQPHNGVDFSPYNGYGMFLVAPENCRVENIVDDLILSASIEPMQRGCGILLKATNSPYYHLFWHCIPLFPVKEGDFVLQGQPVAQMGNTGFVFRNGAYVPVENGNRPKSKAGTHLHWEMFQTYHNRKYEYPVPFINWNLKTDNIEGILGAIKNIVNKIKLVLK